MMQKEEKQVKVSQIMPSIKKRNRLTKRLIFNTIKSEILDELR